MPKKIGIIAEGDSDISVIKVILEKYMKSNAFFIKKFVGRGCGKLRSECGSWAKLLVKSGYKHIIVFHDRDEKSVCEIRKYLEGKIPQQDYPNSIIVIPIKEIEAWLLTNVDAINKVFNLRKELKRIPNCETVPSPKKCIRKLAWQNGKKQYSHIVHNKKIAEETNIEDFQRCKSYKPFHDYICENFHDYIRENVCTQ